MGITIFLQKPKDEPEETIEHDVEPRHDAAL